METNIKTISQHKYPQVQTAEQRTSHNTSIPNGRPVSHLNIPNDRCTRSNKRILSDHRSFVKQIHKLTLHTHRCTTCPYLSPSWSLQPMHSSSSRRIHPIKRAFRVQEVYTDWRKTQPRQKRKKGLTENDTPWRQTNQ